jgi:hypothetical protein
MRVCAFCCVERCDGTALSLTVLRIRTSLQQPPSRTRAHLHCMRVKAHVLLRLQVLERDP